MYKQMEHKVSYYIQGVALNGDTCRGECTNLIKQIKKLYILCVIRKDMVEANETRLLDTQPKGLGHILIHM